MYCDGVQGVNKTKENFPERVSTFLTKEMLAELKQEAKNRGLTVSAFIRMAVLETLNQKKKNNG